MKVPKIVMDKIISRLRTKIFMKSRETWETLYEGYLTTSCELSDEDIEKRNIPWACHIEASKWAKEHPTFSHEQDAFNIVNRILTDIEEQGLDI